MISRGRFVVLVLAVLVLVGPLAMVFTSCALTSIRN